MAKSKKKATKAKGVKKSSEQAVAAEPAAQGEVQTTKERPIIRAIRVTKSILEAAKEYKKATGTSFYTLGHDTIKDRLVKEGYLKAGEAVVA